MRIAYADPPYLRQARRHYADDPNAPKGGPKEVNHRVLIGTLHEHYDAWALSMSAARDSLQEIVPLMPPGARMAAWVKPFASFKPNVDPAYTWEPVIFYSAAERSRDTPTARDHVSEPITMRRGLAGVKPDIFCFWLFELLGASPSDTFCDLFPGSGAVTAAWERWTRAREERPEPNTLFAKQQAPTPTDA